MTIPYTPPTHEATAFNCPNCHAYAEQIWRKAYIGDYYTQFERSICSHCTIAAYWYNGKLIDPDVAGVPPPNPDLDEDIKRDYQEAASILSKSPRGACALLRLAIEKLCQQTGKSNNDLNANIALLVRGGLDPRIQRALDSVRVIGGESVHPGVLDMRDDIDTATTLFMLVNGIADEMITRPRAIETFYEQKLPESKREAIAKRDSPEAPRKDPPDS